MVDLPLVACGASIVHCTGTRADYRFSLPGLASHGGLIGPEQARDSTELGLWAVDGSKW